MAKVFISHSSADKEIVDLFKDIILNAGLGILDNDIAYTSAPETGVPTGGNIPQYIKENIADSDFVFFMISDNYRKSEVCLNEMGAAWALDKNVQPLLLHNVSFKSVGWLYGMNLCAKINDADRLDELRDEISTKHTTYPKTAVWNKKKTEFLAEIATLPQNETAVDSQIEESEELGLLDYRVLFDNHIASLKQIAGILTDELNQFARKLENRAKQLKSINPQSPNMTQMRGIMMGFAKDMNRMSDAIDQNAPKLLDCFNRAMENAIGIQHGMDDDQDTKKENRDALSELIQALISGKDETLQAQEMLSGILGMEKSQIAAQKRLAKGFSSLRTVYDGCITKATDFLKA